MAAPISSARLRDVHGEVGVQEKSNRSPLRKILDHEESGSRGGGGPVYFKKNKENCRFFAILVSG